MRETLIRARKDRYIKIDVIAEHLEMTPRAYRYVETGERSTGYKNWLKIYEFFDGEIPLHELMEETPKTKTAPIQRISGAAERKNFIDDIISRTKYNVNRKEERK